MNKNKYAFMRGLVSRLSLVVLFAVMGITNAVAVNSMSIDNFSIKPGETKLVAVNLNNSDTITSLQADFVLPAGLSCSTEVTTNTARLDREEQNTSLTYQTANDLYRLVILALSSDSNPIMGTSGTIVYLKITAAANFNTTAKIQIKNIHGSDAAANDLPMNSSEVAVTPQVATIATSGNFSIKPDSTLKQFDVKLNNDVAIYGVQFVVTLPAGVSIENKANSTTKLKFTYADRLPSDATVSATNLGNGKYRLILSALSHTPITGNSGVIFSFNVKADKDLAETSNIVFDEVIVSDVNDVAYEIGQSETVKVTNAYLVEFVPLKAKLDALKAAYDAAAAKIAKDDAAVAKEEAIVSMGDGISASIASVVTSFNDSYAKDNLSVDGTSILAHIGQINSSITDWLTTADEAQKAHVSTGINAIISADSNAQIFSAAGQKLSAPVKGLNIIKFSNSQTKKVFVK